MKKPELLAPAGSPEALSAALRCGADAVYAGVREFSARRGAANFTFDELRAGAELCHLYGARLYLALNTVVFDYEYTALAETIKRSAEAGADAFIVQDIGVASLIKQLVPQMPIHASTQMTIHTPGGVSFAKALGCSRVVAARELDKKSLAQLCASDMEIEVFVHGALCMSVSGQCYMSAMIGGRSANRGLCAQACRLPARAGKTEYALSLKDLSLAEHIAQLTEIGVSSLKIEGRMKRPEYVAAAVTAIRAALDGKKPDMETLRAVFSRSGFTDGYFAGIRNGKMFGTRTHEDVLLAQNALPPLKRLYDKPKPCIAVDILCAQDKLSVSDGVSMAVSPLPAADFGMPPLSEAAVLKSLSKLGGSIYYADKISISDEIRLPVSALNRARREAVFALDTLRTARNTPRYTVNSYQPEEVQRHSAGKMRLRIQLAPGQIPEDSPLVERWIVPLEDAERFPYPQKMIVAPPRFITDEKALIKRLERLEHVGLLCVNPAYITIGKKLGFSLHGGFGLNILSTRALDAAGEAGLADAVLSPELTLKQAGALGGTLPRGMIAYGRIPFMLVRCCPLLSAGASCGKCPSFLTDRTGRKLPVRCRDGCAEILNSERLWLADKLDSIRGVDFLLLLAEQGDNIGELLDAYSSGAKMPENCTRGLYFRGLAD